MPKKTWSTPEVEAIAESNVVLGVVLTAPLEVLIWPMKSTVLAPSICSTSMVQPVAASPEQSNWKPPVLGDVPENAEKMQAMSLEPCQTVRFSLVQVTPLPEPVGEAATVAEAFVKDRRARLAGGV